MLCNSGMWFLIFFYNFYVYVCADIFLKTSVIVLFLFVSYHKSENNPCLLKHAMHIFPNNTEQSNDLNRKGKYCDKF